ATRPCALQAGRPRSWWSRCISAHAGSSRPRRAIGDARYRSDLRDVAPHGSQPGDEGLALAFSGAAGAAAGDADLESTRRISGMENGQLDEGQEPVRFRSSRAGSLSGGVCRSVAYPCPLRGLPRRTLCRPDPRRSRSVGRSDDHMPDAGPVGRCRHASETGGPLKIWQEWAPQATGKPVDSGHFLTEENPEATAAALSDFFAD